MNVEGTDILQVEAVWKTTEISAQLRYGVEVGLLRRWHQIADRHVLNHAAAKWADLSHSYLKGWASKTRNPLRQEAILAMPPYMPRQRLRSNPQRFGQIG